MIPPTVKEARARVVYDAIVEHPELVETVADVAKLPRLPSWVDFYRDSAVDMLIDRGAIVEAADGRLCVGPWIETAA